MDFKKLFPYFIIALILLWVVNDCSGKQEKQEKQEIPVVVGHSDPVTTIMQPIVSTPKAAVKSIGQNLSKNDLSNFDKQFYENEIERLLLANDSINDLFMRSNDSVQAELFNLKTALRTFAQKHSDSLVEITATGLVQGELKSMQFFYTLKPRQIAVPAPKEVVFRLYGGLDVGNTAALDKFVVKANIGIQTRNTLYHAAMDSEQRIWFGISKPIFTIKR